MELIKKINPETITLSADGNVTVYTGQVLKIETSPDGEEVLISPEVSEGKVQVFSISIRGSEGDSE